jgi:hypothetical protein
MNRVERLEEALRQAHKARSHPEPSENWEAKVMREIASIEGSPKVSLWEWFDAIFWRLAPVLATLLLVLGLMAFKVHAIPSEMAGDLLQDPLTLTVVSIFGV